MARLARFTSVRVPRPEETRCIHGSYVGYPGGPDDMCGRCEMGETTLSQCSDCGERFWTDGAKRGTCEPNPARAKLAGSLWQLRRAIPNSRKLVRHMISTASEWSIKRRVHGIS